MPFLLLILIFGFLVIFACGDDEQFEGGEYYPELTSAANLVLTENNHPDGWGREDCDVCHNFNNIHLVNRLGIPLDLEAIRELTFTEGNASCPDCHGDNGS